MPIQKFHSAEPRKYDLPWIGQVFCRAQQDGREEWGVIDGVRPVYTERLNPETNKKEAVLSGWTAHLTNGFVVFRSLLTHTATYHNETDWHPAPAGYQMSDHVRAVFYAYGARLDAIEAKLATWEHAGDLLARVEKLETSPILALPTATPGASAVVVAPLAQPAPAAPNPAPVQGATPERPRRGAAPA